MARIDNKEFNRVKRLLRRNSVAQAAAKTGHDYVTVKKIDSAFSWSEYKNPNVVVLRKESIVDKIKAFFGG